MRNRACTHTHTQTPPIGEQRSYGGKNRQSRGGGELQGVINKRQAPQFLQLNPCLFSHNKRHTCTKTPTLPHLPTSTHQRRIPERVEKEGFHCKSATLPSLEQVSLLARGMSFDTNALFLQNTRPRGKPVKEERGGLLPNLLFLHCPGRGAF
jgi:hypothetical protein